MGQSPNIEFARSEFLQGRFSEAERACRQILAGDGNNYPPAYLLGLIARQRGELELAAKFFTRAIAINPSQPDIRNELGRVCIELERLDEALEHFEAAMVRPRFRASGITRRDESRTGEIPTRESRIDSVALCDLRPPPVGPQGYDYQKPTNLELAP